MDLFFSYLMIILILKIKFRNIGINDKNYLGYSLYKKTIQYLANNRILNESIEKLRH